MFDILNEDNCAIYEQYLQILNEFYGGDIHHYKSCGMYTVQVSSTIYNIAFTFHSDKRADERVSKWNNGVFSKINSNTKANNIAKTVTTIQKKLTNKTKELKRTKDALQNQNNIKDTKKFNKLTNDKIKLDEEITELENRLKAENTKLETENTENTENTESVKSAIKSFIPHNYQNWMKDVAKYKKDDKTFACALIVSIIYSLGDYFKNKDIQYHHFSKMNATEYQVGLGFYPLEKGQYICTTTNSIKLYENPPYYIKSNNTNIAEYISKGELKQLGKVYETSNKDFYEFDETDNLDDYNYLFPGAAVGFAISKVFDRKGGINYLLNKTIMNTSDFSAVDEVYDIAVTTITSPDKNEKTHWPAVSYSTKSKSRKHLYLNGSSGEMKVPNMTITPYVTSLKSI